jgi:putative Mg2+ transporter-C (MgtC) family protein
MTMAFFGNWYHFLPQVKSNVVLMLVAVVCGAFIGMDRQRHEKAAGLRTLTLVCLGSAGFTMAGFAFTSATGDSGRVAAQIVTGIGFLGAGVILHPRGTISGATTAASIWVTASVGMIAGAGYGAGAVGLSLLVRLVLTLASIYEDRAYRKFQETTVQIDFDPAGGRTLVRLQKVLSDYPPSGAKAELQSGQQDLDRLTLHLQLPPHHRCELLDDIVDITEVKRVQQTTVGK